MSVLRQAHDERKGGAALAVAACALAGTPFRLRGRDAATGVDCVGLVALALARCGRRGVAPEGYALRSLDISGLLGFAARNGFLERAPDEPSRPGDLLLLRLCRVQTHLAIALGQRGFVHAHAGLGRVTIEAGTPPGTIERRWRLDERITG